jgi:hypothetical protein
LVCLIVEVADFRGAGWHALTNDTQGRLVDQVPALASDVSGILCVRRF